MKSTAAWKSCFRPSSNFANKNRAVGSCQSSVVSCQLLRTTDNGQLTTDNRPCIEPASAVPRCGARGTGPA